MTMQKAAAQAKSNGDDSALSGKLEALLESGYDEDEVNRMIDEIAAELDPEAEQKAAEEKNFMSIRICRRQCKTPTSHLQARLSNICEKTAKRIRQSARH